MIKYEIVYDQHNPVACITSTVGCMRFWGQVGASAREGPLWLFAGGRPPSNDRPGPEIPVSAAGRTGPGFPVSRSAALAM